MTGERASAPVAEARPPTLPLRAPRWPWAALLAVLLVIAAGYGWDRRQTATAGLDPADVRAGHGPASFAEALRGVERDLVEARRSYAMAPAEWLRGEQLALALIARFRLAGDYTDLAEAQRLLDYGLARTPDPAGPVLTKAGLALLVHRLDEADAALARAGRWGMPDETDRADALVLRGDVALQRGQPDRAAEAWRKARAIAPARSIELREALLAGQLGRHEAAVRGLERQLASPGQRPATLATLALQRANLAYATGDWDGAEQWVAAAQRLFPGFWLSEAYAAQGEALAGRTTRAVGRLSTLAERTGRPEVIDALAHLLRLEGQGNASRAWAARAEAGWARRAELFPEAVAQHRAEHELAVGSARRALTLAEADVAARPSWPGIALLARALILAGRPREALAWTRRAHAQGWRNAGLFMLEADACAALGDTAGAEEARAQALRINPRVADPGSRLIWFGHD